MLTTFSNMWWLRLYCEIVGIANHSRICGKEVGLGLFPSDSLQSKSYQFFEIAHIGPDYGVENDYRKVRSNRIESFCENQKSQKMAFYHFWVNFGYISHIPAIGI